MNIVIIGGGLAGLQSAKTLLEEGYEPILLEKEKIIKQKSWKTFKHVIKEFDLYDCINKELKGIYFRTIDLENKKIIADPYKKIPCYVLDSKKLFRKYYNDLGDIIKENYKVLKVIKKGKYEILTNKETFEADIIIDASGYDPITSKNDKFKQKAFYICYCKRYSGCKASNIDSAYFEFDSQFKFCGSWFYPVSDSIVEIGLARFTNKHIKTKELDYLLEKYKEFPPFDNIIPKNAKLEDIICGYAPLLPRIKIQNENIYYVGDAKGAVPYSGYGIENALKSGKEAALSISHGKKYKFFITPPSKGFAILAYLWNCGEENLRKTAPGIAQLNDKDTLKFFTGKIDLSFFIKSYKICRKNNIDMLRYIPKTLAIKAILGLKPKLKDYDILLSPN